MTENRNTEMEEAAKQVTSAFEDLVQEWSEFVDVMFEQKESDETEYVPFTDSSGSTAYLEKDSLVIEEFPSDGKYTAYADGCDRDSPSEPPWNSAEHEPGKYGWRFTETDVDVKNYMETNEGDIL